MNWRFPSSKTSPTASSIGKVVSSLRSPSTTRPVGNATLACGQISPQIAVVLLSVGEGHEDADVTSCHLKCCPPEHSLAAVALNDCI